MADVSKELQIILSARDEASKVIQSMGASLNDLAKQAQLGAAIVTGGLGLMAKSAFDSAGEFEMARVSFNNIIGDAKLAGATLAQLSQWEVNTPFTIDTILKASKQLIAMGTDAHDVVGQMKVLGDVAAGVGVPLDQLTHAFGQVEATGKLTGITMREFNNAGVPLIKTLVDMANSGELFGKGVAGGSGVAERAVNAYGETVKKVSAGNADALAAANVKLKEQQASLKILQEEHVKSGLATEKHNLAIMKLQDSIAATTTKIGDHTIHMQAMGESTNYTREQITKMISSGDISFAMVDKAFASMKQFQGLAENMSHTVPGLMTSIQSEMTRLGAAFMGVSVEGDHFGEIVKGGLFDKVQPAIKSVLDTMKAAEPGIQSFMGSFTTNGPAVVAVIAAIGTLFALATAPILASVAAALAFAAGAALIAGGLAFVITKIREGSPLFMGIGAALATVAAIILASVVPAFLAWAAGAIAAAAGTLLALAPIIFIVVLVGAAVALLAAAWQHNFLGIRDVVAQVIKDIEEYLNAWLTLFTMLVNWIKDTAWPAIQHTFNDIKNIVETVANFFIDKFNAVRSAIQSVIDTIGNLINAAKGIATSVGKGLKIPGFQHGGFVPGGYDEPVLAVLHGGEQVIPASGLGSHSISSGSSGGGQGITINFTGPVSMDSPDRVQDLANQIIAVINRQNELANKGYGI